MTLRLHDTATRSVRDFVPREAGKVGDLPVWAHRAVRAAHRPPSLRRQLRRAAPLARCTPATRSRSSATSPTSTTRSSPRRIEQGRPFWAIAYANEVDPRRGLPRAQRAAADLRAAGHRSHHRDARADRRADRRAGTRTSAEDGSGDVYFDVQVVRRLRRAVRAAARRHARRRPTAPSGPSATRATSRCGRASSPTSRPTRCWPSPWGRGRPGWHIECSAMCLALPGRRVRHPRRRARPDLPAPRERDRPVPRGRAAVRPLLGAPRAAQPRRGQDEQVAGQRDRPDARGRRWASGRSSCATTSSPPHYRSRIDYSDEALREAATGVPADRGLRAAGGRAASAPAEPGDAAGRPSPRR